MSKGPPRILGWRSLLVALALGLGLSALGILAGVGAWARAGGYGPVGPQGGWPRAGRVRVEEYTFRHATPDRTWVYSVRAEGVWGHKEWFARHPGNYAMATTVGASPSPAALGPPPREPPARLTRAVRNAPETVVVISAGWPWHAAWGMVASDGVPGGVVERRGLIIVSIGAGGVAIPFLPLWPGLLGNTIFYATPILLLLTATRLHRRARRRRKNRCVACNYDLSGIAGPCPECGCVDLGRQSLA